MENNKNAKIFFWLPRVLAILLILFLAMFSLDVFEPGASAGQVAVGLLMHNLLALALLAVLIISWKRELVGGIAFILAGFLYITMILANALKGQFEWYMLSWILTIAGPAFVVGTLFLVGWHKRKSRANIAK